MRDCNSARRAAVSTGISACERMRSHWNITPASAAPTSAGAVRPGRRTASGPGRLASQAPAVPLSAPIVITATHCAACGSAANGRFNAQVSSSHNNTPGSAPALPEASSNSHDCKPPAWNVTASATTTCTNSKPRSTTPTWHTSNSVSPTGAASGCSGPKLDAPNPDDAEGAGRLRSGSVRSTKVDMEPANDGATEGDGTQAGQAPGRMALDRIRPQRGVQHCTHCHQLRRARHGHCCVVHHTPWPPIHSTRSPKPGLRCFPSR